MFPYVCIYVYMSSATLTYMSIYMYIYLSMALSCKEDCSEAAQKTDSSCLKLRGRATRLCTLRPPTDIRRCPST